MLIVVWTEPSEPVALVPEPEEKEPPNKKSSVSVRRRKLVGEHNQQSSTNHLLPSFSPLNSFSDESFTKEQQFKINSERKNFRAMRVV